MAVSRFKPLISNLPFLSMLMIRSNPNDYVVPYLFPASETVVKVAKWYEIIQDPLNTTLYALETFVESMLFCKERLGVQHEFLVIGYRYTPAAAQPQDTRVDNSTRWMRVDRSIDMQNMVPRQDRKPTFGSIFPSLPEAELSTLGSFPLTYLGGYYALDTIRLYDQETRPRDLINGNNPDVRVIGRRDFPPKTLPLCSLAATLYTMSLTVPLYDITRSQCYWHAATIWKLLDDEFQSGETQLSEDDKQEFENINKNCLYTCRKIQNDTNPVQEQLQIPTNNDQNGNTKPSACSRKPHSAEENIGATEAGTRS